MKKPAFLNTLFWRRIAFAVAALILLPYLFSRVLSPWHRIRVFGSSAATADVTDQENESVELKIVAYNIAHARGLGDSNWVGDRFGKLHKIAGLLKTIDADVVVLNEVDFDCSWSGGVNQAAWLAKEAGYPYHVEQRNLDFRVLLWRWRFGNAVLSKHPITTADAIDLPGYATWESILAGKKRAVACTIQLGEKNARVKSVRVIGAHLSPRSESLRVQSCDMLIVAAQATDLPCVIAGDFNSAPRGFPSHEMDASGNNAIETLDSSGLFTRLPATLPGEDGFTFPADAANRVIDWISLPSRAPFQIIMCIDRNYPITGPSKRLCRSLADKIFLKFGALSRVST